MLLTILLLSLLLCLTDAAGKDAKSSSKQCSDGGLEEKLESRLRDMETRFQDEKEKLEERMKYEGEQHERERKEMEARLVEKDKEI